MMKFRSIVSRVTCAAFLYFAVYAQSDIPEDLLESVESDVGATDYLETLQHLQNNPVNINSASIRQLLAIPFLTIEQARAIVRHRNQHGNFISFSEINQVMGIEAELVQAIRPYLKLNSSNIPLLEYRLRSHTTPDAAKTRGYIDGDYTNPLYLNHRVRIRLGSKIAAGLMIEKDSGESSLTDHRSGFFSAQLPQANLQFIAGDFYISSGLGLIHGGAYGTPATIGSSGPFQMSRRISAPNRGNAENSFLRGVTARYSLPQSIQLHAYLSSVRRDATVDEADNTISNLYDAGYHRTETEREKSAVVQEQSAGWLMQYAGQLHQFGVSGSFVDYELPRKVATDLHKSRFHLLSLYGSSGNRHIRASAEFALESGRYPGLQLSSRVYLPGQVEYGLLFYNYHEHFFAPFGRAFGKISNIPQGASGIFFIFSSKLFRSLRPGASVHIEKDPHIDNTFGNLKKTTRLQLEWRVGKSTYNARYTRRSTRYAAAEPVSKAEESFRFDLKTSFSQSFRLRHRIDAAISTETPSIAGFAIFQDVFWKPTTAIALHWRWTLFDVPEYDVRLYEFENDLPGAFRTTLLNGRGEKWYIVADYKRGKTMRFTAKYGIQAFPDQASIGSGLDEVYSNQKRYVRIQLTLFIR